MILTSFNGLQAGWQEPILVRYSESFPLLCQNTTSANDHFSLPLNRHQQHLGAYVNIIAMRLWSTLVRMDESDTVSSKQTPKKAVRVKENLELPQIPLIKQYML